MSNGFCLDRRDLRQGYFSPEHLHTGFRLLSREIGEPPRDNRTERVPFSNITYDYDALYGTQSFGERTLTYEYDFLCKDSSTARRIIAELKQMLSFQGSRKLLDSTFPQHHFEVRQPTVKTLQKQYSVWIVTIAFPAAPAIIPDGRIAIPEADRRYPDLNGDGHVTAADAGLILTAAEKIAAGEPSGLTAAQLLLADADLDGAVTEADSLIVLQYAAAVAAGQFEDSADNWHRYLMRYLAMKEAIY